ncbi:MAG TPA: DUF2877 domain-containing protein [Acidimicrobiales bacterium]
MTPGHRGEATTAAGSVLVRGVLAGPVRAATVVATGPAATYLDVCGRLVALVQPGGVHLPCAVVLASPRPSPGQAPAAAAGIAAAGFAVGGGAVHHGGRPTAVVTRWFDPRVRLGRIDPAACERLGALVRFRGTPDALLPDGAGEHLRDGLDRNDARAAAAALLGRGTGLTPAGDDLLAGALAALRAQRSPAADALGDAVRSLAPVRTTRLSAALLDAADAGAVVPEAAAVLRALAPGRRPAGRDGDRALEAAVDRLVAVGHTSGWHLAAGLLAGLTHARRAAAALVRSAP